tara:strand:+ start:1250 stop:1573 length:324 start_codon:yes stop_codon:yes gene_type:complete
MRNEFLGINSALDWVKPPRWNGKPQGNYIKTKDSRFHVSKGMKNDVPMYTAWDEKKVFAEYAAHPEHNNMKCKLTKCHNGCLGVYFFLQEAVNVCEMQLETLESVNA